jgi:hypothetical protein
MRFRLLCELTSSLLVAIMTCSDTGSYNRLDLIQSLIPTHCACNGYTCSDTGSYNRLDLIQSLVPTHCACNGYTCSDTGSYNRLDLIQSLIPTHCACNGYTWTYILKPVIDTLIQYVIINKIQNSLFCSGLCSVSPRCFYFYRTFGLVIEQFLPDQTNFYQTKKNLTVSKILTKC